MSLPPLLPSPGVAPSASSGRASDLPGSTLVTKCPDLEVLLPVIEGVAWETEGDTPGVSAAPISCYDSATGETRSLGGLRGEFQASSHCLGLDVRVPFPSACCSFCAISVREGVSECERDGGGVVVRQAGDDGDEVADRSVGRERDIYCGGVRGAGESQAEAEACDEAVENDEDGEVVKPGLIDEA